VVSGCGVCAGSVGSSISQTRPDVPGRPATDQQMRMYMKLRCHHPQRVAAAKESPMTSVLGHHHILAYDLVNFPAHPVAARRGQAVSLTTLRDRVVKIGARVVRLGRSVTFQWPNSWCRALVRRDTDRDRPVAGAAQASMRSEPPRIRRAPAENCVLFAPLGTQLDRQAPLQALQGEYHALACKKRF
jgi:hypothetical protein